MEKWTKGHDVWATHRDKRKVGWYGQYRLNTTLSNHQQASTLADEL